jgi:CheY-like chemotaxis protein
MGDALEEHRRLDAARIRFLGNIVHELRTPLTVVMGQLEAAMEGNDSAAPTRALRVAARNARRIERMVEQTLQLSSLDAGTLEPRLRELDLATYLESVVFSFEELADRKGLLLEYLARPGSIPARLDSDHVTAIVSNLLSNAMKYTPEGGRVGVAVEVLSGGEGDQVRILVTDTGPGISRERQEGIFRRFQRGPEHDEFHPWGAGTGLALVRELAGIQGGDVTLESEEGRGARFTVTLPRIRSGGEAAVAPLTAMDGAEALELARSAVPDALVSDVRMPGMDGLEVCRRLRTDERTSHIPVLLLSERSGVEERVRALGGGADDFLPKLVDGRELRARVRQSILSREALPATTAQAPASQRRTVTPWGTIRILLSKVSVMPRAESFPDSEKNPAFDPPLARRGVNRSRNPGRITSSETRRVPRFES